MTLKMQVVAALLFVVALGLCTAAPQQERGDWQRRRQQRQQRQQWQQPTEDDDLAGVPAPQPGRQDVSWPGQDLDQQQQPWQQQQQQQQQQASTPAPAEGTLIVLPANCRCQAIENYNPVCGSDGNTYANRQKLECFAMCGSNVTYVKNGVCKRRQDVPV
ncbi:putative mediator of RNA polymerase II transcription subunit 21 [Frankliniella occidentalis]|uniref:Mediator of RNA polymerase II transcription subunit 21 n=1 Tax=Frankliniella occidentalis TaxID=133901 RepID=A0A9C6WPT4_FRAOC|nr:putative mediator of RNA polymerase II transcription subunit 21 [Frankliniella occidentalis]